MAKFDCPNPVTIDIISLTSLSHDFLDVYHSLPPRLVALEEWKLRDAKAHPAV